MSESGLPVPAGAIAVPRIKRRSGPPGESSFDALRAKGVDALQALSGRAWSDYNLHDPGVTILEHLCYGLSDLAYRSGFPVADHLTGPDRRIDYPGHALHAPSAVFPPRPTTVKDYRRALLDRIDDVDNVWLDARTGGDKATDARTHAGLYRITVKHRDEGADPSPRDKAERKALELYRQWRNLCEDVDGRVEGLEPIVWELGGEFEIDGPRDSSEIVAEIYDVCARAVAGAVQFRPFETALMDGALDEVLDHPTIRHGVIPDEALARADRTYVFVGDVLREVRGIDGVRLVRSLALRKAAPDAKAAPGPWTSGSLECKRSEGAPQLRSPRDAGFLKHVRLYRGAMEARVSMDAVRARYLDLRAGERVRRHATQPIESLCPMPAGVYRDLAQYTSIQNHFPAIYGINAAGVPSSETPRRKAQARQLKGYLSLFDQVIANGAAQLHHVRELYSTRPGELRTYWWKTLDDDSVPHMSTLYSERALPADLPDRALARSDDYVDRRNRLLDYLLALHGETLPQRALRQSLHYLDPDDLDRLLLANKLAFLEALPQLATDRAGAFDYSRPSWDVPGNCSGFQRRIGLLLGFEHAHSRSLVAAVREKRLKVVRDVDNAGPPRESADESMRLHVHDRLGHVPTRRAPISRDTRAVEAAFTFVRDGRVSESVLQLGVDLANYRIVRLPGRYRLVLGTEYGSKWSVLGEFDSHEAAIDGANLLRRYLIALDRRSEGMHVVEHVLLRPLGKAGGANEVPLRFYSLRMTVLLPAWTARAADPGCRSLAAETIRLNCPAHVHVTCLWLGFDDMQLFEDMYTRWLQAKIDACGADGGRHLAALDRASDRVAKFLWKTSTPGEYDA